MLHLSSGGKTPQAETGGEEQPTDGGLARWKEDGESLCGTGAFPPGAIPRRGYHACAGAGGPRSDIGKGLACQRQPSHRLAHRSHDYCMEGTARAMPLLGRQVETPGVAFATDQETGEADTQLELHA